MELFMVMGAMFVSFILVRAEEAIFNVLLPETYLEKVREAVFGLLSQGMDNGQAREKGNVDEKEADPIYVT
jgi:hypothetical protein